MGKITEISNALSNVCRCTCLYYNLTPLTSKGSAVALVTPWTSLLVVFEPLLTCGPAPSTCCRTPKASASLVPAAADWLTTAEWTKLLVLPRRTSPGEYRMETLWVILKVTWKQHAEHLQIHQAHLRGTEPWLLWCLTHCGCSGTALRLVSAPCGPLLNINK